MFTVPGSACDGLDMMFVLDPRGEGGDSPLARLHGPVGPLVVVYEHEPPASEVALVVRHVEQGGVVEGGVCLLEHVGILNVIFRVSSSYANMQEI